MHRLKAKTAIREIEAKTETYLQKYGNTIEAISELSDILNRDCPNNCYKKLKEILQKYSIINRNTTTCEGGPSTDSSRLTEGISNAKIG